MSENPLSLRDLPQGGRRNPVHITGFQPPFRGAGGRYEKEAFKGGTLSTRMPGVKRI
jgi:hypothetical protein